MLDALTNGERQVAPDVSGIRRDHVERYRFAARMLPAESFVLDMACGVGYGARILAEAGHRVFAVDGSQEAIGYAIEHYAHPNITFGCDSAEGFSSEGQGFDAAICFETVEHLESPQLLLARLSRIGRIPLLFASVPNEAVFPYRCEENRFQGWAHHHRHYTRQEFRRLLADCGWGVTEWHGQIGPMSDVEPEVEGRTLIAVAERVEARSLAPSPLPASPRLRRAGPQPLSRKGGGESPSHVAIVGLGPSCISFFELTRRLGGVSAFCDEVWGLNAIGDTLACERVFHMDDVRVQEMRAAERPESNIAAMVRWLKRHPGPIYTSIVREGYPGLVAFPLQDVLNAKLDGTNGGAPYFNSTAAYAIAYAIHIGVKTISLWGLDYTLASSHKAEQGRACCEFWLGIAAARGIEIMVPEASSLMDACAPERDRLYGYDLVDVHLEDRADGSLGVTFTEREDKPTAEEIERRYDHAHHPNRLVRQETAA